MLVLSLVSIPYRFNETTRRDVSALVEYRVSIPYRFNETPFELVMLVVRSKFQFLIGSMRRTDGCRLARYHPRFNSL